MDYGVDFAEWDKHVSTVFQGLKREMADEVASGVRICKSGRKEKGKNRWSFIFTARQLVHFGRLSLRSGVRAECSVKNDVSASIFCS